MYSSGTSRLREGVIVLSSNILNRSPVDGKAQYHVKSMKILPPYRISYHRRDSAKRLYVQKLVPIEPGYFDDEFRTPVYPSLPRNQELFKQSPYWDLCYRHKVCLFRVLAHVLRKCLQRREAWISRSLALARSEAVSRLQTPSKKKEKNVNFQDEVMKVIFMPPFVLLPYKSGVKDRVCRSKNNILLLQR